MKTAREVATSVWDSMQRGDNVIDAYVAAIEARDRELVEVAAKEAERETTNARVVGMDDERAAAFRAGARIRALIPKEAP